MTVTADQLDGFVELALAKGPYKNNLYIFPFSRVLFGKLACRITPLCSAQVHSKIAPRSLKRVVNFIFVRRLRRNNVQSLIKDDLKTEFSTIALDIPIRFISGRVPAFRVPILSVVA